MHVQFAELPVHDQDRAKSFYVEKLRLSVAADVPMGEGGWRWIELKADGAQTAIHFTRRADDAASGEPTMVLIDDDVTATVGALRKNSVEIISEPGPAPYDPSLTVAAFRDSEGNYMILSSGG